LPIKVPDGLYKSTRACIDPEVATAEITTASPLLALKAYVSCWEGVAIVPVFVSPHEMVPWASAEFCVTEDAYRMKTNRQFCNKILEKMELHVLRLFLMAFSLIEKAMMELTRGNLCVRVKQA
jgi:hypothetical protein